MTQKANMMEQFLDDVPHAPIKHGAVLLKRTRTHNHNQTPFGAREFWMSDDALYCSKIGSTKALECIRLDDVHSVSEPQCIGARELQPLHFLDSSGTGTNKQDHGRASHHAAGQDKDKLSPRSITMQDQINLVSGMTHTHAQRCACDGGAQRRHDFARPSAPEAAHRGHYYGGVELPRWKYDYLCLHLGARGRRMGGCTARVQV